MTRGGSSRHREIFRTGLDDQSGGAGDLREHLIVLDESRLDVDRRPIMVLEVGDQQFSP
jgi:hypothetical protein